MKALLVPIDDKYSIELIPESDEDLIILRVCWHSNQIQSVQNYGGS